ncbi:MAG: mannose-6-phosphate isomerase, class I [Chitinophagaceae bacterium]|nr:mannose-6-phosphate isomerase, class I [Chitinophagaceae bacterium]MCW5906152.1 mannose-6-phosphate isomerase, class I [Chitinophagaceae bacterium]
MQLTDKICKLKGKVQHYAWGGYHFIPELLKINNSEQKPFAEYWLGSHPSTPSILTDKNISLVDAITQQPENILGKKVYEQFKGLPYLFKVLDVKDMLSIQVHPTKEEAIKGFEREEAEGIPINAPNRNYKDKNHKPEMMIALGEFWLLHGFQKEKAIEKVLENYTEFNLLIPIFKNEGYKGLYQTVMKMPQEQVDTILIPLVEKAINHQKQNLITKNSPEWWVAKWYNNAPVLKNIDRGIFSIYLFNLIQLQKGEAIFQGAGVPHAYLEGQNIELMANSDNVLRGGLTPKHIDIQELMKHTKFEAIEPAILKPLKIDNEKKYPCSVNDFAVSAIELSSGKVYHSITTSLEILLVIEGAVSINELENYIIQKGESFAVIANTAYSFTSTENTLLFKAFVPV